MEFYNFKYPFETLHKSSGLLENLNKLKQISHSESSTSRHNLAWDWSGSTENWFNVSPKREQPRRVLKFGGSGDHRD